MTTENKEKQKVKKRGNEQIRIINSEYMQRLNQRIDQIISSIPVDETFKLRVAGNRLRFAFAWLLTERTMVAEMVYEGITEPEKLNRKDRTRLSREGYRRLKRPRMQKALGELQRYLKVDVKQVAIERIKELLQDPSLSPKDTVALIQAYTKLTEKDKGSDGKLKIGELLGELKEGEA